MLTKDLDTKDMQFVSNLSKFRFKAHQSDFMSPTLALLILWSASVIPFPAGLLTYLEWCLREQSVSYTSQ